MDYLVEFSIELVGARTLGADVYTRNHALFSDLRHHLHDGTSINPRLFTIRAQWNDPLLREALKKIAEDSGAKPVDQLRYANAHRPSYFHVQVHCCPTKDELSSVQWLYLDVPPQGLAEFERIEPDDSYVVGKVTTRRKLAFGCTRTVGWMLLFTEALTSKFRDAGLNSAFFRHALLKDGRPSGLWQLWSTTVMPPKLDYWAGSYIPPVLRYEVDAVKDLPKFDVAVSSERAGPAPHNMHRYVIVSQRFREVAEKLAPGQFKFGLVAVGQGEELKRRYTLPELAPPEDAE